MREHLALEMIEEDRLKKGLIQEETRQKSAKKRLNKMSVLSQHRPDIRDLVKQSSSKYTYSNIDI